MLSTVGAILIAFSIMGLLRLGIELFADRAQYWGMFPKKKKTIGPAFFQCPSWLRRQ